jgi:hypothetical protein
MPGNLPGVSVSTVTTTLPPEDRKGPEHGPEQEVQFRDIIPRVLPQFALPSFADLCGLLNPVYDTIHLPEELRYPCVNLNQMRAYIERRLRSGG